MSRGSTTGSQHNFNVYMIRCHHLSCDSGFYRSLRFASSLTHIDLDFGLTTDIHSFLSGMCCVAPSCVLSPTPSSSTLPPTSTTPTPVSMSNNPIVSGDFRFNFALPDL